MWLYRGAQSAVFYYVTCTPCANSIDRRKRRKEAARSKRDKEKASALVTDQPRPFPQPTPFSTNEGWREEILLGPGPPARRHGARHHHNVPHPTSWNMNASAEATSGSESPAGVSNRDLDGGDGTGAGPGAGARGPGEKKDRGGSSLLGERWNWMRYQREDEPLWGENGRGSSLLPTDDATSSSSSKYYIARVPPVNDLHPPVVSGPKSRAETRWMLQPPPSAKVMAGKERVGRGTARMPDENSPVGRRTSPERKLKTAASPEDNSTFRRQDPSTDTNTPDKPPPVITVSVNDDVRKTPSPKRTIHLPRPPPPALDETPETIYGRDESNFVISTPGQSRSPSPSTVSSLESDGRSPSTPWQFPDTPVSRPVSKTGNATRSPAVSKTLSTLNRESKNIHLLHLEINDSHDDVGFGRIEHIRPWRWSMDI